MRRTASTVAVVLFLLGGGLAKADPGEVAALYDTWAASINR